MQQNSKSIKNQIWVLMAIALVCGILIAGVKLLVGDLGSGGSNLTGNALYEAAYENGLTYTEDGDFTFAPKTLSTSRTFSGQSVAVAAEAKLKLKINASDGAVLCRIEVKSTNVNYVDIDVIVAVNDSGSVLSVYLINAGGTYMSSLNNSFTGKKVTNILSFKGVLDSSSASPHTANAFLAALELASDIGKSL